MSLPGDTRPSSMCRVTEAGYHQVFKLNLVADDQATAMRFFLAGIMQGSHLAATVHNQDYRQRIKRLLVEHFPGADIYDPLADHTDSLDYDDERGRSVFFRHNRLCSEVDVVVAFVPEASMGTAVEMWEAHRHGKAVIAISPMKHNWAVKFLSHALYADVDQFEAALASGHIDERLREILDK